MPYRDLERKREYDREWIRRKKLGLDTKIVGKKPSLSPTEQTIRDRINSKNNRDNTRIEVEAIFKNICFVCQKIVDNGNYHKKDGESHPKGIHYINNHKDEFVYTCHWCHRFIHVLMKLTKWNWKQIEKFIFENRSLT